MFIADKFPFLLVGWSCWVIIRVHLAHDYTDECHQRRVHRSIKWPTGFATAGRLLVGALPFVCSSPKLAVYFIIFQLLWLTTIAPLCMNSFYYLGRLAVTRRLLPLTLLCEFVCSFPPKQTPPPQAEPSCSTETSMYTRFAFTGVADGIPKTSAGPALPRRNTFFGNKR